MIDRNDWLNINAIINDKVYEIKSEIILQPGPASLLEGLPIIHNLFNDWYKGT